MHKNTVKQKNHNRQEDNITYYFSFGNRKIINLLIIKAKIKLLNAEKSLSVQVRQAAGLRAEKASC